MIDKTQHLSEEIFKEKITTISLRDGFGEGLVTAGEKNQNVVALTADLTESTRISEFAKRFPDRYFEVGVAEQALVTIASGMAKEGKIPFATSFAVFSPGRNWEQIRTTICLNNVPVKIVGSHGGVSVGKNGATHQALEDIALMRVLPNMVVVVPADTHEAKKATIQIAENEKPTYLRLVREKTPIFTSEISPFEIGKANILWKGRNPQVAIIACGPLVYESLLAAKELEEIGIETLVTNSHTIKPLDETTITNTAKITGSVVTVEDHQVVGGLGSAVSEVLSRNFPVPIEFIGVKDVFGESGNPDELKKKFGIDGKSIADAVKRVVQRKNN